MKEMTSVATTMMTEEEKAEVEKQMNSGNTNGTPQGVTSTPHVDPETKPAGTTSGPSGSDGKPPADGTEPTLEQLGAGKKRQKLTPEQRKKLEEMEEKRKKDMEERIDTLTKQLIERLRPFVDAEHPGERTDPETMAFEDRMRREADDLKLESFGVEVRDNQLAHGFVDVCVPVASAYDWICIHDESHLVPEVEEIPGHVSVAIPPSADPR